MLDERQIKLAAAILAVKDGRITAAEAAALVKDPSAKLADFFKGGSGVERVAQLSDPQKVQLALKDAGVSDEETHIIAAGDDGKADQVVRKTLFNIAPTMPPQDNPDRPSTTRLRRPSRITERERYSIKREFARGGQGRIMIARDNVVGREVALKELLPEVQEAEGAGTPATAAMATIGVVERFLREAKVTGQLEHPNVVPVYEIGKRENGSLYYTMKFVRGQTMAERLHAIDRLSQLSRDKRLALRLKLLEPFQGTCNAVAFAHSRGVIHRDLKPQNIMCGDFGENVLLDWGLARVQGQEDKIGKQVTMLATNMLSESLLKQNSSDLTMDGTVFGTPHYMPPEQARADLKEIDEQSDVYSLGAILYEILTGAPPYDGPTAGFILQQVMAGPPRKIKEREPNAPPELIALCERAMAHDKARRMKTAVALAQEVQAYRDGRPLSVYKYNPFEQFQRAVSRYKGAVLASLLVICSLLAGGVFFFLSIISEKSQAEQLKTAAEDDRDKTALALEKARQAQAAQQEIKDAEERDANVRREARQVEIKSLRSTISGMRFDSLAQEMTARVTRYEDLEAHKTFAELPQNEQTGNANLLMSALGFITAQESLVNLLTADDSEIPLDSMQRDELARMKKRLVQFRLLAARLATFNSDFLQASLLISASEADESTLAAARTAFNNTRDAILAVQRAAILAALADAAAGLARPGRESSAPSLKQYVASLSAYKERQTVELMVQALAPLREKAKSRTASWTRAEIDTATLVCRVLGGVELPLEATPPLTEFLASNPPASMAAEAAIALCETKSPLCLGPLCALATEKRHLWVRAEECFAAVPIPASSPQAAQSELICIALSELARGRNKQALEAASTAIDLDPNAMVPRLVRGYVHQRSGELEQARSDFTRAMTLAPANPLPCVARGDLALVRGDFDQAAIDYSQALSRDGQCIAALIGRGMARTANYDYEAARSDLTKATTLDPMRADAWLARAAVGEVQRNGTAEPDFAQAIEVDPYYAECWTRRGIHWRTIGSQGSAIADLTHAITLNPDDPRNYSYRAQSHSVQGHLTEAVNDATMALDLDPNDFEALFARATTYLQLKGNNNLEFAVADLEKMTEVAPEDYRGWILLGDALVDLKRPQDAVAALAKGRRLAPFGAEMLGASYEKLNALYFDALAASAGTPPGEDPLARILAARKLFKHAGTQLAHYRSARSLALQAVSALNASEARARLAPWCASVIRGLAFACFEREYFSDAAALFSALEAFWPLSASDAYLAARAAARLAGQFQEAAVRFLGEDDKDAAALEASANGKSAQDRAGLAKQSLAGALNWLKKATQAGFFNDKQAASEKDLAQLHAEPGWEATLKAMAAASQDKALAETLKEIERVPVVLVGRLIERRQALARGVRAQDIILKVADREVRSLEDMQKATKAQQRSYPLTIRRYTIDDHGDFVQKRDASGKLQFDGRGLPVWQFEDLIFEMMPGMLGIQVEIGSVCPAPAIP